MVFSEKLGCLNLGTQTELAPLIWGKIPIPNTSNRADRQTKKPIKQLTYTRITVFVLYFIPLGTDGLLHH